MKYQNPTFSSGYNSTAYRDGWDRIFGREKNFRELSDEAGEPPTNALAAPTDDRNDLPESLREEARADAGYLVRLHAHGKEGEWKKLLGRVIWEAVGELTEEHEDIDIVIHDYHD